MARRISFAGVIGASILTCSLFTGSPSGAVSEDDPSLHLTGASNARDLGVYHTWDRRSLRPGLIFRSNKLHSLTQHDIARIQALHVFNIIDLRQTYERRSAPDPEIRGVREIVDDILDAAQSELPAWHDTSRGSPTPRQLTYYYTKLYQSFVNDQGERNVIHDVIRTIISDAQHNHPVLYHCSEGKDRTGWISAILLTAVGVEKPVVYNDYLLSNKYLHTTNTAPLGVDKSYLDSAFQEVQSKFTTFDRYWSDGLKLTNSDRDQLREAFLLPR